MAGDPYKVLGVGRTASQEEIQKAFRKQAKVLHPDLNPGDKKAEQKFKDISAAYEIIGDKDKRARYDRGEIGPDGSEQQQRQYYREYAGAGAENPYHSTGGFADFGEGERHLFAVLFAARRRRRQAVPHAGTGRAIFDERRVPGRHQRHADADPAAERPGARRQDPGGHARRPDAQAEGQGPSGRRLAENRATR